MGKPKTLLIMCGSLGMGNASRLLGVAQFIRHGLRVPREELRLLICAAGRPARFWQANAAAVQAEVTEMDEYVFSGRQSLSQRVSWAGFFRPRNAAAYARNTLRLRALLGQSPADLALIDSDYHFLPLILAGVPVTALGQARDVVRRHKAGRCHGGSYPWDMLLEKLDFGFQRLVSRLVLVPCFEPASVLGEKVMDIPLIVREEFAGAGVSAAAGDKLYVLTGGSGIGSAALLDYARRYDLQVIGSLPEPSPVLDPGGLPLIDRAAAVLVQGGLSSISECIARRKKMIVLPIAGHAEQLANAEEVERLGLGLRVSELSVPPDILLERLRKLPAAAQAGALPAVNGAEAAAGIVMRALGLERAGPSRASTPERP